MDRRSDLIVDSRLDTRFDAGYTVHTYREHAPDVQRGFILREEVWLKKSQVGRGAYGTVWLENCVRGNRDIEARAVKQVSTRPLGSGKQIDYSRELEAIAKFSHNKYVHRFVRSFGWYEAESSVFIAMEYLPHGDLGRYLEISPPLSEETAGNISHQILEGLSYMHSNGYAHRDLKPGNILIRSSPPQQWWVKIGDFGISKRIENETAKSTLLQGTLGFVAPELHGFGKVGTLYAADMWALGEISFQLMTKSPVFKDFAMFATYALQPSQPFPSSADLGSRNISSSGQSFISSLMVPTPEKRLTAEGALNHKWIVPHLPLVAQSLPPPKQSTIVSIADSITSGYASWDSIATSNSLQADLDTTIRPKRVEIPSNSLQTDVDATIQPKRFEAPKSTSGLARRLVRSMNAGGRDTAPRKAKFYLGVLVGHAEDIWSVAFSPDGARIAAGHSDGVIAIWNAATGGESLRLSKLHTSGVHGLAFSPLGETVASGSTDMTIKIWDAATGKLHRQFDGHTSHVFSVVFSPDGKTIASASLDKTVRIWDVASGKQRRQLDGHSNGVLDVAFSPDGRTIASASGDATVRIWDAPTGGLWHLLKDHAGGVWSVAFSPDGKTLASGSYDKTIRIWDVATGRQLLQLNGHTEQIYSVKYSPNGKVIASGSVDNTVRIWDATTGRPLQQINGHNHWVTDVAFSPDSSTIVSGSRDRKLQTWAVALAWK